MFKNIKNEYSVKTAPTDEPQILEELLNTMSFEGWELYTLHEAESKSGSIQYNCIFYREFENSDEFQSEIVDISDFKSKMEKMLNPSDKPYEECKEIQRKIKEKQKRISKIKNLLDSSTEDINRNNLNDEISKTLNELKALKNSLKDTISTDKMYEKVHQEKLCIVISEELLDLVNPEKEAELIGQTVKIRQDLTERLGYVIPAIRFTDAETLETNEYSINVRGIPTITGRVYLGYRMFYEANMGRKPKDAIEDVDSINGEKVFWIEEAKIKDFWEKGLNPSEVIAKNLEYISLRYVDEILDYADMNKYIELVGSQNIFLVDGIIPDFISIGDLRYIFASLIKENVPVSDVVYIFERLNDFSQDEDKENILEELRVSLKRNISQSIADNNRNINGIIISDSVIQSFEKELLKDAGDITIKASLVKKLSKKIKDIVKAQNLEVSNTAVICPMSIRHMLFVIFEQIIPGISVLAREEISKEFNLLVVGTLE